MNEKLERKSIEAFLNEQGQIRLWPAKREKQLRVLEYLAERFETDREYTEREINQIVERSHTFGDYFLLRRELVDARLLQRTRDGAKYWRTAQ